VHERLRRDDLLDRMAGSEVPRYNPNTYVCHNGVDTRLYDFELPKRRSVNIGFAGGEGHLESVQKWLPSIHKILDEFEQARFIAMGPRRRR
jgi:hypothetical protein